MKIIQNYLALFSKHLAVKYYAVLHSSVFLVCSLFTLVLVVTMATTAVAQQGDSSLPGCNNGVQQAMESKQQALQQMETETAKALITKPTSVQQLTCFDQYSQRVADEIGSIHSQTDGISDVINPYVKMPNLENLGKNFLSGILFGGLQSMFSNIISSINLGNIAGNIADSVGLGGVASAVGLGGSKKSAIGNCEMMKQMWDVLQCVDFPRMPSLNDIINGSGNMSGILGGLGGFGNGQGIMGQVCKAAGDMMNGSNKSGSGRSGGGSILSAYDSYLDALDKLDDMVKIEF